jgi:hypothetical protein
MVLLKTEAEDAFHDATNMQNMAPMGATSGTPILTTTELLIRIGSGMRSGAHAPPPINENAAYGGEGFSRKPVSGGIGAQDLIPEDLDVKRLTPDMVSLELVMSACPEIKTYGGRISGWHALVSVADHVRPMLGIHESAWREACETLGHETAAAAIALILQRVERQEITAPGGYLRGMTAKARRGELNIARSFHALAEANLDALRTRPAPHQ